MQVVPRALGSGEFSAAPTQSTGADGTGTRPLSWCPGQPGVWVSQDSWASAAEPLSVLVKVRFIECVGDDLLLLMHTWVFTWKIFVSLYKAYILILTYGFGVLVT